MDFTKIKVVKKLGTGMYATTYLVEHNGKQYALKKQKILEGNRNRNSRSITWRDFTAQRIRGKIFEVIPTSTEILCAIEKGGAR